MDEVVGNINQEKEKQDVAAKTDLFISRLEDHWVWHIAISSRMIYGPSNKEKKYHYRN